MVRSRPSLENVHVSVFFQLHLFLHLQEHVYHSSGIGVIDERAEICGISEFVRYEPESRSRRDRRTCHEFSSEIIQTGPFMPPRPELAGNIVPAQSDGDGIIL